MKEIIVEYENQLRGIARDLIEFCEPEHVDHVVDGIISDMYGGGSKALELILSQIDDSMGFYEIRSLLIDFKADIDIKFFTGK